MNEVLLCAVSISLALQGSAMQSSPIALTPDEKTLCAVNQDSGSISLWRWPQIEGVREIQVGEEPRTLAISPDGRRAYVTNQSSQTLSVVDLEARKTTATIDLGGQPYGIILNDDGSRAFVSQYAGSYIGGKYQPGTIAVIDLKRGRVEHLIPVKLRPWALARSQGNPLLYATHYLQIEGKGMVTEIDTETLSVRRVIALEPEKNTSGGRGGIFNGLASIALHPQDSRALVTGIQSNVVGGLERNGQQLSQNTMVQTAVRVMDLRVGRELRHARMLPSLAGRGVAVPSAVVFMGSGDLFIDLYFASSDYKVLKYNEQGIVEEVAHGSVPAGPTGIVLTRDGSAAFVASRWDRSVTQISLENPSEPKPLRTVKTTNEPWSPQRIQGAILFHDAGDSRMSSNRLISCASCHLDGGIVVDGLTWDLTVPGIQPKFSNTMDITVMAGSSPPFFHRAVLNGTLALEIFVRAFQGGSGFLPKLEFSELERISSRAMAMYTIADELRLSSIEPSPEWTAMLDYMNSLRPRPNPHRNGSKPREEIFSAAERGRELFFDARQGCALCHKGPLLTNSKLDEKEFRRGKKKRIYDIGTGKVLDVPALANLWDTSPYLHDGRAATLRDVLTIHNDDDWHGQTSHLKDRELDDLATFLLVAGDAPDS